MNISKQILKRAKTQILGETIKRAADEKAIAANFNAFIKAAAALDANETIRFDGATLSFISSFSGKTRTVTIDGCAADCDCQNKISYHSVLFAIADRAAALTGKTNVVTFPQIMKNDTTVLTYTVSGVTHDFCRVCAEVRALKRTRRRLLSKPTALRSNGSTRLVRRGRFIRTTSNSSNAESVKSRRSTNRNWFTNGWRRKHRRKSGIGRERIRINGNCPCPGESEKNRKFANAAKFSKNHSNELSFA